jgi:hypothetical protein
VDRLLRLYGPRLAAPALAAGLGLPGELMFGIPVVVIHALSQALAVEAIWKESSAQIAHDDGHEEDWPIGYCVDASIDLHEELIKKVPEAGAEFVYGFFYVGAEVRVPLSHSWIEVGGGFILDITLAQFFREGTERLPIVLPTEDLASRYLVIERNPSWAANTQDEVTPA